MTEDCAKSEECSFTRQTTTQTKKQRIPCSSRQSQGSPSNPFCESIREPLAQFRDCQSHCLHANSCKTGKAPRANSLNETTALDRASGKFSDYTPIVEHWELHLLKLVRASRKGTVAFSKKVLHQSHACPYLVLFCPTINGQY